MTLSQPHTPSTPEQRIASLAGDRLCTTCFYNLRHQPIIREPHYNLLILRCPECGTASGIEDHPTLGKWPRRTSTVLSILWYILILTLTIAIALALFGMSSATSLTAAANVSWEIETFHEDTLRDAGYSYFGSTPAMEPWWSTTGKQQFIAQHGGYWKTINPYTPLAWIPFSIFALLLGMFIGITLKGTGTRSTILWSTLIAIASALFSALLIRGWLTQSVSWSYPAAIQLVSPPMLILTLPILITAFITGLLTGPRIGNWTLRRSLPASWIMTRRAIVTSG